MSSSTSLSALIRKIDDITASTVDSTVAPLQTVYIIPNIFTIT